MKLIRMLAAMALPLVMLAIAACAGGSETTPTASPRSFTDDAGRTITVSSTPQRILSISPAATEILYALGLGDKIVGVDDFSDYPPEAQSKPKVGAPFPSFNLEAILSLDPDIAFSTPGIVVQQLEQQGLMVVVLDPPGLDGIYDNILMVGEIAGGTSEAQALVSQLRARVKLATDKIEGAPRPRVFYEVDATDLSKPYTAAQGSFVHELIQLAGGENIFAEVANPYPQVGSEAIVARDPQVILLGDALVPYNPQTPEMVAARPGWSGITAVKNGAIHPVNGDLTTRPGPRIVEGLEEMARLIHPELFP